MKKVFIIDDDKQMHETIEDFFKSVGPFEFYHSYDGKDVTEIVHTDPDLIVCDVYLENTKSGIEVIQEIRGLGINAPIILSSGYIPEMKTDLIGVVDLHYLPRPFDHDKFSNIIDKVFKK